VVAGNDIYLAAYIENESYWASIAVDDLGPASSGRSFVSANGAAGSWQDLGATFRADVAFRARMASCAAMTTPTATPTRTPTITATPSRTAQPTMTPTGPTRTSLPKVPRLWLPPVLRQYQSRATPTPTATLSMTSTATPTPTFSHTPEKTVVPTTPAPTMPATLPANWVLDWAEDFSQPGAFLEGEWPGFHVHRERGEYRIEILATRQAVPSSPGRLYQDVALEVQGRFAAKESGNYGLVLATNDLYDGYYFRVNDQGQYGLRAKAGFGWQDVIPWTWSEHVHRGLTPNRLRMERVGSFLYLYLNGNHISTVRREEMPSQLGIALVAGSHDSVPVDMRFDNFQVYVPADARTGLGGGERRSRAASVKED
ncbi:MAG: hypothetical protein H5T69_19555, partial [Chloroflexi bacterium]|nr:hypothetical protein [Chloroflexota bacterium]